MVTLCRNQRRKNHPEASWISHSIIYFSHFFFSALSQECFHGGQKPASFYFTSLLLIFRKYIMGESLKQLFNHYSSFIYGVCMLLSIIWCLDLTVNCFFYLAFRCWTISNKWDCRVSIRAERWLVINCLLRIFIVWSEPYLTDALLFFLKMSCQRMMVQKLSPRRGSNISGLKKFLSEVCSGALLYSRKFKILLLN